MTIEIFQSKSAVAGIFEKNRKVAPTGQTGLTRQNGLDWTDKTERDRIGQDRTGM